MEKLEIKSVFTVYNDIAELPDEVAALMQRAVEARSGAYAPYSRFRVGAAVLLDNGEVVTGSNQENASYPSGLCAERVALFHAGAQYPDSVIKILAITATSDNRDVNSPVPPCGACRQVIAEYETKQKYPVSIYFMGKSGKVIKSDSLSQLLPLLFTDSMLH